MNKVNNFDKFNTHVFEAQLPRTQQAEIWKLEKNDETQRLQDLFDKATDNRDDKELGSKYINEYQSELDKLQSTGKREFTLTKGIVSELVEDPEHTKIDVPIKVQIKEGVLTWYFAAPMDQTKQRFRDEVFLSAGLAQVEVDHSTFRYMRGTNSVHLKKMHTKEEEALMNHNHYTLEKGFDFTPERFKQHLDGFVKAEKELEKNGIITDPDSKHEGKFLTQAEADEMVKEYESHWNSINSKKSEEGKSILEENKELGYKRLTREDRHEYVKYSYLLNIVPFSGFVKGKDKDGKDAAVRSTNPEDKLESETYIKQKDHFTINPNWPLSKRINAVKSAMRGGYSNRAQVRQIEGSKLHNLAEINKMNDEIKIDEKKPTPTTKVADTEIKDKS